MSNNRIESVDNGCVECNSFYVRKSRRTCTLSLQPLPIQMSQRPSLNLPQLRSTRSEIKSKVSPHSHSRSVSTCRNWVTTLRAFAFSGRDTRLADHISTPTTPENGFRRSSERRHSVCQGEDTDEQSTEDNIEKGKPSSLRRESCFANPDHQ